MIFILEPTLGPEDSIIVGAFNSESRATRAELVPAIQPEGHSIAISIRCLDAISRCVRAVQNGVAR